MDRRKPLHLGLKSRLVEANGYLREFKPPVQIGGNGFDD